MKKLLAVVITLIISLTMIIPASAADIKKGDANGDGKRDMKDVLVLRKYLAHMSTDIEINSVDINADSKIDMKDVLLLRKFLAHMIDIDADDIIDPNEKAWMETEYELDEDGNVINTNYKRVYNAYDDVLDEEMYDFDGSLFIKLTCRYNEKRQIILEDYNDGTSVSYTYDEDGNITMMDISGEIQLFSYEETPEGKTVTVTCDDEIVFIEKYDKNGNLISDDWCDGMKWEYAYDDKGNKTQELFYFENQLESKTEYTYDENGNPTVITERDADGNVIGKTICTYDENGNLIEEKEQGEYSNYWVKYTYDSNGNLVEEVSLDEKGNAEDTIKRTYNQDGKVIEYKEYDSDGEMYIWEKIEYTYF